MLNLSDSRRGNIFEESWTLISSQIILKVRHLWFITHNFLSLLICYCIQLLGLWTIDICDKISYSSRHTWYLRLRSASFNVSDSHYSTWFCRNLIFRVEWINCSFRGPFLRIDVFIIELKVGTLSWHILFKVTRLCSFDSFSVEILRATFNISKRSIHIWLNLWYITNVKFVMNKSLWFNDIGLRLQ